MLFRRSTVRYSTTPVAETPYQAAQQIWDDRIGSSRVQAYHWRLTAISAITLATVLTAGLIWLSTRSMIRPYIVEVDARGAVQGVGPVDESFRPTDRYITVQLSDFLKNVRSLPLDPIVLRQNWLKAYAFVSPRAAMRLNEYARDRNPFAQVGRESIAVDVTSVVRASSNSFQLRWVERTYRNGALTTVEYWTALLSVTLETPNDEERMRVNPLGIYVDGLDWSRELSNDTSSGDGK